MPKPNWGNTHDPACPVTTVRKDLWRDFCRSISNGPDERRIDNVYDTPRDYLWGCVIEYAAGGDEDIEQCDCTTYHTPEESQRIRAITANNMAEHRAAEAGRPWDGIPE